MAIINKPPAKVARKAITVRMPEPIVMELHRYATFLDGILSYVAVEALKLVFRKDAQFSEWLIQNPIGTPGSAKVQAEAAGSMPPSTLPFARAKRSRIRPTAEQSENVGLATPLRIAGA